MNLPTYNIVYRACTLLRIASHVTSRHSSGMWKGGYIKVIYILNLCVGTYMTILCVR